MVLDFCVTLFTENIREQIKFYRNFLGLDFIFDQKGMVGLGLYGETYIILREKSNLKGNSLPAQNMPALLMFKCQETIEELYYLAGQAGYDLEGKRNYINNCPEYLFLKDFDGNEVVLDLKD